MRSLARIAALALTAASLPAQAAKAPRVVKLEPAHLASDVDASVVTRLVITFDQNMSTGGWSFCGGGPQYPRSTGSPFWKTPKVCILAVDLEPDHDYRLSLNCPAARNFRSAKGVPLDPTPWSFATQPAKPLSKREQRAPNKDAVAELREVLERRYSYYDYHDLNWRKIYREHEKTILSSQSPRAWASAASTMLKPTGDLHLYLRYGGNTYATGSRRVDSLFRKNLLSRYFEDVQQAGNNALTARTEDGIGYLVIGTFGNNLDSAAVTAAIAKMKDTKALIIDVRPNSGGNELLAREIAAWFVDGVKVYAKNTYRRDKGKGKKAFGPVLDRTIEGNSDADRYPGPVAVLMSRYNMSSCEAFLLMMKQAESCTLVGQRSYGSSGNPKTHGLSNGVEVIVPSWMAMEPDGTCFEGKGIAPDVEVEVTAEDLKQRDPILERALSILRQ